MMHPKSEELFSSQVLSGGLKNLNPGHEATTVVIHIYFLVLHELLFTLAYSFSALALHLEKEDKKFHDCITSLHHKA